MKRAERAALDARLAESLRLHRVADRASVAPTRARADAASLADFVAVPVEAARALRPASDYRSRTYDPGRRLREFVDHLFVRYPVPTFLYRAVLTPAGFRLLEPAARPERRPSAWLIETFFAAAQGRSVADVLQGRLTRKEAHWFLQAPTGNTLRENMAWAVVAAAGAPRPITDQVAIWLGQGGARRVVGHRLREAADFFVREGGGLNDQTRSQVLDFLVDAYRDPAFSLVGRTAGSVVALADAWHISGLPGGRVPFRAWPSIFPEWERRINGQTVRAVELTNSRKLAEEGRKQRHCVYMHMDRCLTRWAAIVSLRWTGPGETVALKRLTVEVRLQTRQVVEAQFALNRPSDDEERAVLRRWAGDHGLTLGSWV